MASFVLRSISLLSEIEQKARKVEFDRRRTLIFGKNDTGKSSLIKSIYSAFGASPVVDNPKWKKLNCLILVEFEVNGELYKIFKNRNIYSVFSKNNEPLIVTTSVTSELGPFIADLFNFQLKAADQKGKLVTPPPAYLFIPFYVDQDEGWRNSWKSFANLKQIKNYPRTIINYHIGLRPNEYYVAKAKYDDLRVQLQEKSKEKALSKSLLEKLGDQLNYTTFDTDIKLFKSQVDDLLLEAQKINELQLELKAKLQVLYENKAAIRSQTETVKRSISELIKDFQFSTDDLLEGTIECPTCGAEYENSFIERFKIAQDEENLRELLNQLIQDELVNEKQIKKLNKEIDKFKSENNRITELLSAKKEKIKLQDIIESQSKRELYNVLGEEIKSIDKEILGFAEDIIKYEKEYKKYDSKDRKKDITDFYIKVISRFLHDVGVESLDEKDYRDFTKNIKETGSTRPRTVAAYFMAFLATMKEYSSTTFCPVVIDSPNQQAQDFENIDKVLNLIKNNQPEDSQLILGLENMFGVDFDCKIVHLEEKYGLLQSSEYESVYEEIGPLIDLSLPRNDQLRLF